VTVKLPVFVVTEPAVDAAFGDEFEGHVFTTSGNAVKYIGEAAGLSYQEAELELTPAEVGALYSALRKTKAGGHKGGRPREAERCPCGKFTVHTAAVKRHKCKAKEEPKCQ